MQKWGYTELVRKGEDNSSTSDFITSNDNFLKEMFKIGSEGYECYAVTNDNANNRTYYFKKPYE